MRITFPQQKNLFQNSLKVFNLVPGAGLEPARSRLRGILSPLCLPIPPPGQLVSMIKISRNENIRKKLSTKL